MADIITTPIIFHGHEIKQIEIIGATCSYCIYRVALIKQHKDFATEDEAKEYILHVLKTGKED